MKNIQMSRIKFKTLCAICGVNPGVTKDHIPPQSLYPRKSRPENLCLNYVMACADCNNGASKDDEKFKIYIGLSTGDCRRDSSEVIDSMAATLGKNRRLAVPVFDAKVVYAALHSSLIRPVMAVTFDFKSFESVVTRIIKALYWMETGSPLGKDVPIKVFPFHSMDADFHKIMEEIMVMLEPKLLNDKTFAYKHHISDDGSSIWGIQFFGSPQTTTFAYAPSP
ncbi:MAG: hypothetical protein K2Q15_14530, partial [Burkholderiales bacterium]|nr:hypothetical protein [Burkholderiales bacterium]